MRERILSATVHIFEKTGARGATTRRIADEAGVNEVTVFRHFGSKDALLREAVQWAVERPPVPRLPDEPEDPRRELASWCRSYLEQLHRSRVLIRTSLGKFEERPAPCEATETPSIRATQDLLGYLDRLADRDSVDAGSTASAAAAMLLGALLTDAITRDITPERYPYDLDDAADRYGTLFLRAVGARV